MAVITLHRLNTITRSSSNVIQATSPADIQSGMIALIDEAVGSIQRAFPIS